MKGVRKIKWSDRLKIFITQIGGEYKVGLQLSGSEELPKEETNAIKKFLKRYTRKSRWDELNYISSELSSLQEYSIETDKNTLLSSALEEKVTGINDDYNNQTLNQLIANTINNYNTARENVRQANDITTTDLLEYGLQTIVDYAMMNLQEKSSVSEIEERLYVEKYFVDTTFFKGYDASEEDIRIPIIREYLESLRDVIIGEKDGSVEESKTQLKNITLLANAYSHDIMSNGRTNQVKKVAGKIGVKYFSG